MIRNLLEFLRELGHAIVVALLPGERHDVTPRGTCSPLCPCGVDLEPAETEEDAAAACAMDPGCLDRTDAECAVACPWERWHRANTPAQTR